MPTFDDNELGSSIRTKLNNALTKVDGIEDGATDDQTGAEIKALYELEPSAFTDAQFTKLAGIETGATADQTGAEIKALYEAEADTNAFTDADHSKLDGIEAGATADQTDAEIKTAYENNADTNAFTDADESKLDQVMVQFDTVADLLADTNTYSVGTYVHVKDGDFTYKVVASGGDVQNSATTPVQFDVVFGDGRSYPMAAFDIPEDGVTDAAAKLTSVITAIGNQPEAVTLVASGPLVINSTVDVIFNVHVDLGGQKVSTTGTTTTIFNVQKGGSVWNGEFDLDGIAYTGIAVVVDPNGVNWQGHQNDRKVLHELAFRFPANSGKAYRLDAATYYIQYIRIGDITVQNGAVGGELDGSGNFCNGNHFGTHIFFDTAQAFSLDNANGNEFAGIMREKNTYDASIDLVNSKGNRFRGIGWDDADITCDADSDYNDFGMDKANFPNITDNGRYNKVTFSGGETVGNIGYSYGHDLRMGHERFGGTVEFTDDFLGGPSPKWTQNIAAGGSINTKGGFEGNATPNNYIRRCQLLTNASGVVEILFNDQDCFVAEMNPIVHLIFSPVSSSTGVTRIGLMRNNTGIDGVYFETDEATHGDSNLRLVVDNGGTQTVTDTGVAATSANNLFFATLEITPTNIHARLGHYIITAANDDGRVGRGVDCLYTETRSTFDGKWDVTTNIPVSLDMQPVCYASDATNSAKVEVAHYRVVSAMYATNN